MRAGRYGTVRLQRAVTIGDRQNPGAQGNVLAAQSGRIPEPIPAFVMAEHELTDGRAERHALQNVGADTRMDLDAFEFLRRQGIGLGQDVFGHRHVADVMQQRRGPHGLHLGVAQPGRLGEHGGVLLDRSNVLRCAARLGFDRQGKRFDGRQLHFHGAVRLVLLLAQPCDDRVVAAEHEVERHGQKGQPSEPAPLGRQRRNRGEPAAGQVARGAPQEIPPPGGDSRLTRRERNRAGDERGVDDEIHRRDHGSRAEQSGRTQFAAEQRHRGRPATATVTASEATLNTTRWSGLRSVALSLHCAQAPATAMQMVGAGPSAKSDQKFTACENDRFDWLRPSGRSILAADVITASAISTLNRIGRCRSK